MLYRRPTDIPPSEITDEAVYWDRRRGVVLDKVLTSLVFEHQSERLLEQR